MNNLFDLSAAITEKLQYSEKLSSCKELIENYNGNDWREFVSFTSSTYHKILLKNFSTELFDMYIICWNPLQLTKIHDHPDNGCLMKVLRGSLTENLYINNIQTHCRTIVKDHVGYLEGSSIIHNICNHDNHSVTLHIYAPANYVQNIL